MTVRRNEDPNHGGSAGRGATYLGAGVDVGAAHSAVELIKKKVRATFRQEVVSDIGHFGGMFAFDPRRYREPVLVSSTDGVGTKVMIAERMGVYDTIGIDLVAMSVNDVAVLGAEPLFFLDYILVGKTDVDVISKIVDGVVEGCRQARCALIGGEIAEHPGHLAAGSFDLAGFCVGVVEKDQVIDGSAIREGDAVIGLGSSGLHSNGFSLVRKVLLEEMGMRLEDHPLSGEASLGDELLRPTIIYSPVMLALRREAPVKGFAHVTQGGIESNLGRILPGGLEAVVERGSWEPQPIFGLIGSLGRVDEREMFRTFNMGIGMIAIVASGDANRALDTIRKDGHRAYEIGSVRRTDGAGGVRLA